MTILEAIFQDLNRQHFAGCLPLPRLLWNSRLASTAGRFCPGSRNPLRPRPAEIEVAAYLKELPDGDRHVRDTVLHEMIHYYLWHVRRPHGHTAEFHRIMKRVGAQRYNPVPRLREVKYWYECPCCRKRMPARRKLAASACAACCTKHNGGRYTEKFRLVQKEAIPAPEAPPDMRAFPPPQPDRAPDAGLSPAEIIRRLEEIQQLLARTPAKKPH